MRHWVSSQALFFLLWVRLSLLAFLFPFLLFLLLNCLFLVFAVMWFFLALVARVCASESQAFFIKSIPLGAYRVSFPTQATRLLLKTKWSIVTAHSDKFAYKK